MRPPWWMKRERCSNATLPQNTYNVVVLAAHGVRGARVASSDTHNGDRGAVKTDLGGHVLDDDAEEGEKGRASGRVRLRRSSESVPSSSPTEAGIRTLSRLSQH